ncbi:MAG: Type 1 glutamine amidotransferase-like domain-containing protein, partial [Pseudomonadota bacterium]
MFSALFLTAQAYADPDTQSEAALVIAGGALDSRTEDVWRSFIDAARDEGPIVIVPSASGSPVQSAESVRGTLLAYGVGEDRIATAKLATMDDRSSPAVNEALWAENSDDPEIATLLKGAAAIWFTGGDQARTTKILLKGGHETQALSAIRTAAANGAPIGGTSAGAAIMSKTMLLQGDSLSAL